MEHGEISRGRKLTAVLGMLASAGAMSYVAALGVRPNVLTVGFTAVLAGSGLALTRGPVLVQVLARGVAWLALLPCLVYLVGCAVFGRTPELEIAALGFTTGLALLAARPSLGTPSALADFAPNALRRLFLTGGTITAGTAMGLGTASIVEMVGPAGTSVVGVGLAAVAASMLGSVVGVMKMRSWGVLLGGLTSLGLLGVATLAPRPEAPVWILLALPTLLGFVAPVVLARLGLAPTSPSATSSRIALDTPTHVRIALDAPMYADHHAEESLEEASLPARRSELRA